MAHNDWKMPTLASMAQCGATRISDVETQKLIASSTRFAGNMPAVAGCLFCRRRLLFSHSERDRDQQTIREDEKRIKKVVSILPLTAKQLIDELQLTSSFSRQKHWTAKRA